MLSEGLWLGLQGGLDNEKVAWLGEVWERADRDVSAEFLGRMLLNFGAVKSSGLIDMGVMASIVRDIVGDPWLPVQRKWPAWREPRDCRVMDQDLCCVGCGWKLSEGKCGAKWNFEQLWSRAVIRDEWVSRDVVNIAQAMYEGKDFGGMGQMGDALMEAGCDAEWVLGHCRERDHWRGCWLVDCILEK